MSDLLEKIEAGCLEGSPRGFHLPYRCDLIEGNIKLAKRPKLPEEKKDENDKIKTLIETRGQGGYIIGAPTFGSVNPDGNYRSLRGSVKTIAKITTEERALLHDLARTFDQPDHFEKDAARFNEQATKVGERPGDDFNLRATWSEVLEPHGWQIVFEREGISHWRRPGKKVGISATTNYANSDLFFCFSTSTPFEPERGYSKFSAYTVLNHGGDFSAAARQLQAVKGTGVITVNEDWFEPLLFGEVETPELSTNLLPGFLKEYCRAVAEAAQTPSGLAIMIALSTIAACVQKRFEVSPYQDDYTEPLSLWTVTALDSGNRKTAVKNAMTEPLTLWEREQAEMLKPKIKEVSHRRDINLQRISQLKAKAAKPETPTAEREKYLQEILQIEDETPDEIKDPRVWTDDVTPERLQALLADHKERMALLSDEGGIFEVMGGLYNNGRANINVFLQGHAGSPVRVDRQGRTVMINKPALTFGLAVQNDIICNLSQGSKSHFRGNGTLARFLYCVPKSNIGTRDITRRSIIPEKIKIEYQAGIMVLLSIEPIYDEHGREQPRILTLTSDALQAWQKFSQWIESRQGPDGEFCSIQDWTSKLSGAALRIAGLFHVVEYGTLTPAISRKTIERSLDLCELLISHARAAFDLMGDDPSINDAKIIFSWILARKEASFRQNEVFKEIRRFRTIERLEKALKVLTSRHIIRGPMKRNTGGRPSITYDVNPEILKPV
jgi:putative DNA primase/helicase